MSRFPKTDFSRGVARHQAGGRTPHQIAAIACLLLVLFMSFQLAAQGIGDQRLREAYRLEREGNPTSASTELRSLLDSKSLDAAGIAKAWDILGLALQDQGDFSASRGAFEQSIRAYEGLANNAIDFAMTLDDFGELYIVTGQADLAIRMMKRALSLYEAAGDHAGMARASGDLAGALFSEKKFHEGRKDLDRGLKESKLTNQLDDDDLATLVSLEGWLAQSDGDFQASVSKYQRSLDLLRKYYGEEHASTGWGYVLLGEAHAETGDLSGSLMEMDKGLTVLGRTLNGQDPRLLSAEIAYSRVLDRAGKRSEAASIRASAERQLRASRNRQCIDCTISADAFR